MRLRQARSSGAFSLVEVVIALGVTIFCLIALFGLLSVGLRSNRTTIEQASATSILSASVADLYATPQTVPPGAATSSLQYNIKIPANPVTASNPGTVTALYFPANGQLSTNATPANSAYLLTVTPIVPSTGGGTRTATFLDLKVTWPANVTPANAAGTVETFVSLNRN